MSKATTLLLLLAVLAFVQVLSSQEVPRPIIVRPNMGGQQLPRIEQPSMLEPGDLYRSHSLELPSFKYSPRYPLFDHPLNRNRPSYPFISPILEERDGRFAVFGPSSSPRTSNENDGASANSEAGASNHPSPGTLTKRVAQESSRPNIKVDFPLRVTVGEPFRIDVWIEDEPTDPAKPVSVYMEQTDAVLYKPRSFTLKKGERRTVIAQVLKSTAGLAQIQVTSDGYPPLTVDVNAGFKANLRAQVDDSDFSPGGIYGITLNLVDSQNIAVPLDTPISLSMKVSNALIRPNETEKWTTELTIPLLKGATATDLFQIKPLSIAGHPVTISAVMRLDGDRLVLQENHLSFPVHPAWWFTLGLAMLGGIIPGLYRTAIALTAQSFSRVLVIRAVPQVIGGIIAGAGAYLLADLDVIGVKLDTSSPRSFCILGFLFAYVGLDVLMKRFAIAKQDAAGGNDKTEAATTVVPAAQQAN